MRDKILEKLKYYEDEMIKLLSKMVKIPSVSGDEAELAEFIKQYCLNLGFESEIDRHGNVIAAIKGSKPGPKLCFNSHLDTVPVGEGWTLDPFGGEIIGDRMYGRGSTDCKAAIASQIIAARALVESGAEFGGELVLTYVVEEEVQDVNRKGTYRMLKDGFTADMCVNGEDTDLNVCLAGGGMLEVTIITKGVGAHGATPEEGKNAIFMMYKILSEIDKLVPGYNKYIGSGSINVGTIEGGKISSVVPDRCTAKISRFTVPGETGSMFYSQILSIIERIKAEDSDFDAVAEMSYTSNPSEVTEDEQIVKSIVRAHEELGMNCELTGTPQHMDADFLVNIGNIPTVIYGPGTGLMAHMPDEYVLLKEVVVASRVYALTAYDALNS